MSRRERNAMENPFSFSGIVDDPAFCNREKEQAESEGLVAVTSKTGGKVKKKKPKPFYKQF